MTRQLKQRISELRQEIALANAEDRRELLDHLEQAVLSLEVVGAKAPDWAREKINQRHEEEVEDQFDNMPV